MLTSPLLGFFLVSLLASLSALLVSLSALLASLFSNLLDFLEIFLIESSDTLGEEVIVMPM